jgi:predicted nucleic acid-binding protein
VALPVVALGEFRYGIARSRHRRTYEAWLRTYLHSFELLLITAETSEVYARIRLALRERGKPIPANDVWIAALAVEHGMPLLTRDAHFDVVPDLVRRQF